MNDSGVKGLVGETFTNLDDFRAGITPVIIPFNPVKSVPIVEEF
jgi:hypothetical protein